MHKFQNLKNKKFRNFQKQGRYSFVQKNGKKQKNKNKTKTNFFLDFQNQGRSDVDN